MAVVTPSTTYTYGGEPVIQWCPITVSSQRQGGYGLGAQITITDNGTKIKVDVNCYIGIRGSGNLITDSTNGVYFNWDSSQDATSYVDGGIPVNLDVNKGRTYQWVYSTSKEYTKQSSATTGHFVFRMTDLGTVGSAQEHNTGDFSGHFTFEIPAAPAATGWIEHTVWIRNASGTWDQYKPWVYNGSSWDEYKVYIKY